jgi:hypothetical protein
MKKKSLSFTAKSFIALALLVNLMVVPSLVRAQQSSTVCQVSYTSAPPIPGLQGSPFNVIIQGMFNFVHSFNSQRFNGTVTCPAPTPPPPPPGDSGGVVGEIPIDQPF